MIRLFKLLQQYFDYRLLGIALPRPPSPDKERNRELALLCDSFKHIGAERQLDELMAKFSLRVYAHDRSSVVHGGGPSAHVQIISNHSHGVVRVCEEGRWLFDGPWQEAYEAAMKEAEPLLEKLEEEHRQRVAQAKQAAHDRVMDAWESRS